MSKLTKTETLKIADLARIDISREPIEKHQKNLSNILDFIEQINALNTGNIKPMFHPRDISQRLREDETIEDNNLKTTKGHMFKTPKVKD